MCEAANRFAVLLAAAVALSCRYSLVASAARDRSAPQPLEGRTLVGNAYVFTTPETGASRVSFWLDDPAMSGPPRKIEGNAPFDFAGTGTATRLALPFDTRTVPDGAHEITAKVETTSGDVSVVRARFVVDN